MTWRVGAALMGALAFVVALAWGVSWRDTARGYDAQLTELVDAVAIVTDNPKLKRTDAAQQLYVFGSHHDRLVETAKACSDRVAALGSESKRLQNAAEIERKRGQEKRSEAERAQTALEASARSTGHLRGSGCISQELARRWGR